MITLTYKALGLKEAADFLHFGVDGLLICLNSLRNLKTSFELKNKIKKNFLIFLLK